MIQTIRAKRASEEEGFTLIELMVVVLIIAILLLIAIPTFLGARQRAQDAAVKSNLRNALTSAKTLFTDKDTYAGVTPTALQAVEPSLTFQTAVSVSAKEISVAVTTDAQGQTTVYLSAKSDSGTCFQIADVASGPGTEYGTGSCTSATAASNLSTTASTGGW
jgi:type IV pilus assembly protein PilA